MTFEEKANIEIIKTLFNPKKEKNLVGCYNGAYDQLVYTDNGLQIFTIPNSAVYIDYKRCFPNAERIDKLLYNELETDISVPTFRLYQVKDGRVLEEFETVEGNRRSMWIDRKLLARFEQPSTYMMGKDMIYLENEQGVRYGAIMRVRI